MAQVFISAPVKMRERWSQAFPEARVLADVAATTGLKESEMSSLWLDFTAIPADLHLENIAVVSSLACPVVAMVGVPGEAEAFSLLNAGVHGYCHVEAAPEQLCEISLVVENGGLWMPPPLMQRFLALSTRAIPAVTPEAHELNDLTAREVMVAEQVAHGASNREIAAALEITERTVKAHLSAIFDKLGVRDRVQLALRMNNIPTYSTVN